MEEGFKIILTIAITLETLAAGLPGAEGSYVKLNALNFVAGNVITTKEGMRMLALSEIRLAYCKNPRWFFGSITFHPVMKQSEFARKTYVSTSVDVASMGPKSVALVNRLINKKLHYGSINCNAGHYMDYVLTGEPHNTPIKRTRNCPLARPLKDYTVEDIDGTDFYLTGSRGTPFIIREMPPWV